MASSPWAACVENRHRSLCCRTWGLSEGSKPGGKELLHQHFEVGNINIKHGYKRVLCTENIISQGTGVMATCPLVGSQQASPAAEEGGEEGTGEVPVLPSKRGFTPLLPPNAPGGVFPGWMVLFLGGGGVIQWGLQSPWDGSGLGLARREVHRWAGGLGCSSRCCAPSSRQQPQPGHLGRQEGVDDEDNGLGAGVKVQLLQKRKGGMFAMGRAVPAAASFQPGTTQSSPNPPQLYWGPGKGCAP